MVSAFASFLFSLTLFSLVPAMAAERSADGRRMKFQSGNRGLVVEIVAENVAHFEFSANAGAQDVNRPIYVTPMVAAKDLRPVEIVSATENGFTTRALDVHVDS